MNNKWVRFTLIFIGAMFYFFANFQRIAIPGAVFDVLQHELRVSAPYITAFGAIFMYIYAFSQLVNGVLVDRYGGLRVMMAGGVVLALGCLLFPATSNLALMYFSRALVGLGGSMFYLSLIRELRECFSDKNFGIAISVMLCIGYSGGIAANAPFVFAMKYPERVDHLILNGANLTADGMKLSVWIPIITGYRIAQLKLKVSKAAGRENPRAEHDKELLGLMVNDPNINGEKLLRNRNPEFRKMPKLVIAGDRDMIKDSHTKLIWRCLPDAELRILPGTHFIAKDEYRLFNRAVETFLGK